MDAAWLNDRESALRLCAQIRCPALVVQGTADAIVGPARGPAVAAAIPGARLITFQGSGHAPHLRDPVAANLVIRDFACPAGPPPRRRRGRSRPRRALYISSPIGLGHALRDVAIASELRTLLYFPLGHHFEQTIHVRHRLGRYRAGRCMDYETSGPAEIAAAIASEIGREVDYRPVARGGAARAAALLAGLL